MGGVGWERKQAGRIWRRVPDCVDHLDVILDWDWIGLYGIGFRLSPSCRGCCGCTRTPPGRPPGAEGIENCVKMWWAQVISMVSMFRHRVMIIMIMFMNMIMLVTHRSVHPHCSNAVSVRIPTYFSSLAIDVKGCLMENILKPFWSVQSSES